MNLAIKQGSFYGLVGMNGSGKSTIFKLIFNEIFKTFGKITFKDKTINSESSEIYEELSLSPQTHYLNEEMTVNSHLRIFCAIKGVPFKEQKNCIDNLLRIFNMEG